MSPKPSPHIRVDATGFAAVYGVEDIVNTFTHLLEAPSTHPLHVTLVSKEEGRLLQERNFPPPFSESTKVEDLIPLGIGGIPNKGVSFIVILFNSANLARKRVGLPAKNFHITLAASLHTSADDYPHDLSTLISSPLENDSPLPLKILDALALHHFSRADFTSSLTIAVRAIDEDNNSFQAFTRLGDAALKLDKRKAAMLSFAQAYDLSLHSSPVQHYCMKRILECSSQSEWGTTMTRHEWRCLEQLFKPELRRLLFRPWSMELRDAVRSASQSLPPPTLCLEAHDRNLVPGFSCKSETTSEMQQLQRFFRWVIPFHLAVSSEPRSLFHVASMCSPAIQIRHILTLTKNPLSPSLLSGLPVNITHLPMDDHTAPTDEQVEIFLRLATSPDTTPLLVHCAGGKGRAGTMIACYLMAFGWTCPPPNQEWRYPAIPSREAIAQLRMIRPGSLETSVQEDRVKKFANRICARGSPLPAIAIEPNDPFPFVEGTISKADLLILVGIPGSGKSEFRRALVARDPSWTYVSGDEDGGTSAVIAATSHTRNSKFIVDRCNTSVKNRQEILGLAHHAQHPVAIFFDVPSALCLDRAQRRTTHPSLTPGQGVSAAIKQFEQSLTQPQLREGFVGIATVRSVPASVALAKRVAASITIFKFPRTPHLINLGAQTDDDLTSSLSTFTPLPAPSNSTHTLVVTEKIDGANLGFSLNGDREILTQNRSHYIHPSDHIQFKSLGIWVEQHRQALDSLLARDQSFPERYILYGEWLAATHSVQYTSLPDLFLGFDLYDRSTRQFISRPELVNLLKGTGILLTPILYQGGVLEERELLKLMKDKSKFSSEVMEGIYCKVESSDGVISRGKVVRANFIAGSDHWTKGRIKFNSLQ